MKEILLYIVRALVSQPDAVSVTETETPEGLTLAVHVAHEDMGKVIGRGGRVAKAIRTVLKSAAPAGVRVHVDIEDS